MTMFTIVIIAPTPVLHLAMIAGGDRALLLPVPIIKPAHYLACRIEHIRAMTEERGRG